MQKRFQPSKIVFLLLLGAMAAAGDDGEKHGLVQLFQAHKPSIIEFSVGAVAGSITQGLVKMFAKFAIVIGAGVFVVANGAMRVALPKEVMDMEAELGKQAVGFLDFNQDGKIDMEDAKSIHQKALPFIKKHVPLSAGFLSGFTFSL
mmetsp:Transcript_28036/g.62529  ORF Transcript_28036/g.62529 Transcript_28036/m.62529 type:complete len:147 (+) Transcript_28036:79-519(+)